MSHLGQCPHCGKLIALRFPIHDCTPPPTAERRFERGQSVILRGSDPLYQHHNGQECRVDVENGDGSVTVSFWDPVREARTYLNVQPNELVVPAE